MTYQMPVQFGRQSRYFWLGFLNAILAKRQLPGIHGFLDYFNWMRLAHGN
jgi:hypothetical protein